MRHPIIPKMVLITLTSGILFLARPASADYTSAVSADATMTGDAAGDTLTFTDSGGLVEHNRFTEGDAGFNSNFDFDTAIGGDQTVAADDLIVNAGDGDDVVDASVSVLATSYTFNGEGGNDTLTGSPEGDVLDGGDGDDTLIGRGGSDVMFGGTGDDHMVGGDGDDFLFGQDGSDTFEWHPGEDNDTIEGQDGTDVLDFNGANIAEIFNITPNGSRILLTRNVANIVMDLNDVEEIHIEAVGGDDVVNAVPFANTSIVVDGGTNATSDTLNYDCQGGDLMDVTGAIQVVGNQPLFHSNFENVILTDCVFVDTDGDGTVDALDNCPAVGNPDQADGDGDGLGDACDEDPDGDGIGAEDNCPNVANADQADTDGDGLGNACDPDVDGDGTENGADNCPLLSNPDQADADEDGAGDVCDPDAVPPPPPGDEDEDGVADDVDNCTEVENPDQEDTDTDGIGDACDCDGEDCTGGGCSLIRGL